MSKRNISEVSNPVENIKNKKMKTETRPVTKEEVDELMDIRSAASQRDESLRKSAEEAKKNKSRNLASFQKEIDDKIAKFRDDIQTLNNTHFTRQDWKKISMSYALRNKDMAYYCLDYIIKNKNIPREFSHKNNAKIIQELLWTSQTSVGKLFTEYYPKYWAAIEDRIKVVSVPNLSEKSESIQEVRELRSYANQLQCQINV